MNIAWLGMGIMGSAMAANCLKAGHQVTVYNRTRAKCEPLRQAGAQVAETPAEASRGKEAILMCIEDTKDVEEVIFGSQGLVHGLANPAMQSPPLVIDHSTISADATARFAARLRSEYGAEFIDAPVSGGDVGARAGTLSIMCGGSVESFERTQPILQAMGKTIVHVGTRPGDGQRAKMINQMVVAINCMATTEGMRIGEALGMDMEKVLSAISQGAASSWSLVNLGPRWLKRDFQPGFRLRHLLKDVQFCQEAIHGLPNGADQSFPAIKLALDVIYRSVEAGNGDLNIHSMARVFPDFSRNIEKPN